MNNFYARLLVFINEEREAFNTLVEADNTLGLNLTSDEIITYLEFSKGDKSKIPIVGNIIITEGDVISILRIINDIIGYEGEYIIYINEDNAGINTYLITRANLIYNELNKNVSLKIDYSENYNKYLNELVTIVGSKEFVNAASKDFSSSNQIIM